MEEDEKKVELQNIKPLNDKNNKKDKKKKVDKRTVILIVVTIILSIVIITATVFLVLYKMKLLDEEYIYKEDADVFETEKKKEDTDKVYILSSTDRINYNDLTVEEQYIVNGEYSSEMPNGAYSYSSYIQIKGLANKEIEDGINKRIFGIVKEEIDKNNTCKAYIRANFSNILSIYFYVDEKNYGIRRYRSLNIDLNTGNDIKFEDLFTKSTPIYSVLFNEFLRYKAWDTGVDYDSFLNSEDYFEALNRALNMDNRDTSKYEEYLYKIIDEYDKNKENIIYSISPTYIEIYGFDFSGTYHANGECERVFEIPLYEYKDYITLFKKYVKGNIYERDVAVDNVRPMYELMSYPKSTRKECNYFSEQNNLMIDVGILEYDYFVKDSKIMDGLKNYLNKFIDIANSDPENYYVLQCCATYGVTDKDYINEHHINQIEHKSISYTISFVKIPIDKKDMLDDIIAQVEYAPAVTIGDKILSRFKLDYVTPILGDTYGSLYFDMDGNYLGNTDDVIKTAPQPQGQS